ncbi:MAG: hypothetical protein U0174_27675 [Polyangiaceae bacterium]
MKSRRSLPVSVRRRVLFVAAIEAAGACAPSPPALVRERSPRSVVPIAPAGNASAPHAAAQDRKTIARLLRIVAEARSLAFAQENVTLDPKAERLPNRTPPCGKPVTADERKAIGTAFPDLRKHGVTCLAETDVGSFLIAETTTGKGDCNGSYAYDQRVLLWEEKPGKKGAPTFARLAEASDPVSGCPCARIPFVPFDAYLLNGANGAPSRWVVAAPESHVFVVTAGAPMPHVKERLLLPEAVLELRGSRIVERIGEPFAEAARYRTLEGDAFVRSPQADAELRESDAAQRAIEVLRRLDENNPQELDFTEVLAARKRLQL